MLGAVLAAGPAPAAPFVPADDALVLDRLPDREDAAGEALRRALAADPHNVDAVLALARHDIERAQRLADPRWLGRAEAAMRPLLATAEPPPKVVLLHAVVLQSNHDFAASLTALGQVLAAEPRNGQAWLTRASIEQVGADYRAALADCGHFAALLAGLAADTCTAGVMALTGRAPLALRALTISLRENAAAPAPVRLWAATLAAETAAWLDDASAERRFVDALAIDAADPYLLGAWTDWLLDHARHQDVIRLLAGATRIDPLLLRLALAEQALGRPEAAAHIADLAARFETSRLRGDTVHRREEARFRLQLQHDPQAAVALAAANWTVQREPADALVLLQAALAAGKPAAAAPVLAWLRDNRVQNVRLAALAAQLAASAGTGG